MNIFVLLWSIVRRILNDLNCLLSSSALAILKLNQRVRVHFVTLIEVNMHPITYRPGQTCFQFQITSKGSFSLS